MMLMMTSKFAFLLILVHAYADTVVDAYAYAGDDNANAMLILNIRVNYADMCCLLNAIATAIDAR